MPQAAPTVSPELARAAQEWQAEEHATAAQVEKKIEAMEAAGEPSPDVPAADGKAPTAEEQAAQAAALTQAASSALPLLARAVWGIVDRQVVRLAGPELALEKAELEEAARLTVPVIEKYLPATMTRLVSTPEGALVLFLGLTYGSKMVLPSSPAPAASSSSSTTAAPTPSPGAATPAAAPSTSTPTEAQA